MDESYFDDANLNLAEQVVPSQICFVAIATIAKDYIPSSDGI